jgi:hypothetical protein
LRLPFWCVVFASVAGLAQDTVPNIKNGTVDLSVPESPAFTVLGMTPSTVVRPASPRALAADVLNGVDKNGNFQTGVAIDTAPYMLFFGNGVTLEQYQHRPVLQFLARTQFSFATVKGSSQSDKSTRLASGLSLTIFDRGDPRLDRDFVARLAKIGQEALGAFPPLSPLATDSEVAERKKQIEQEVETKAKAVREAKRQSSWNRSSWVIAGAPSWISQDGTTTHLHFDGAAVWSSLAYGFEGVPGLQDSAQVIVHGRFHSNETVPDPEIAGTFYQQQSTVAGARMRFGTENTIGSFETTYLHTRPVDRLTENYFRLSVGAERRLNENLWLHLGIGGESGRKNGKDQLFILGAFKWGTGPK